MVEISKLIKFPVFITVSDPENYTFALFGKSSDEGMEEEPVVYAKFILEDSGEYVSLCNNTKIFECVESLSAFTIFIIHSEVKITNCVVSCLFIMMHVGNTSTTLYRPLNMVTHHSFI